MPRTTAVTLDIALRGLPLLPLLLFYMPLLLLLLLRSKIFDKKTVTNHSYPLDTDTDTNATINVFYCIALS